jgi:Flp pilus assembly protein TadD/peroxiredoxin
VQAGSGFLSQHTKNLFFGLGKNGDGIRATVGWPSGLTQSFDGLPINHSIEIVEGQPEFVAKPFSQAPQSWTRAGENPAADALPSTVETWLIEPVRAPDFSLPDLAGNLKTLQSFHGNFLLLNFWTVKSSACIDQLRSLQRSASRLTSGGIRVAAINVDLESEPPSLRALAAKEHLTLPVLLADQETTGIYAIVYRYLFDRHRDLPLPASLLIDPQTYIIKLYQGPVQPEIVLQDATAVPTNSDERARKALPFPGALIQDTFRRNDFTYGVAFFQNGFLKQAAESFRQVIAEKPDDAEAYYNLGTLCLRTNSLADARQNLEQSVQLRPDYSEAWNNLGMLSAQEGKNDEAIRNFQHSLELRPTYATALLNLGNLNRRLGNLGEAEGLLQRALHSEPDNPEINYGLGMLYARKQEIERAIEYLEKAIQLRPDYSDARNNLGVIFVQTRRYPDAEQQFKSCIQQSPSFDQAYLNLARLYLVLNDKDKARAALESLLHQNPQHNVAQQMLQMLY